MTRTSKVGYLRDIRRLTVALSRARLGLYILGRREIFETCYELREAFELLLQRPDKLTLVTGELWPSERILAEEAGKEVPGETVMEGVEHLGQYVYEMTNTRLQQLRSENGLAETSPAEASVAGGDDLEDAADKGESGGGGGDVDEEEEEAAEVAHAEGFEAEEE